MVFGVSADELQVSRETHKVDGIPEGLDITSLTGLDRYDYIDGILCGEIGNQLMKAGKLKIT